jgi:putative resolvase
MTYYMRIGKAAELLGVCTKTLRRWDKAKKLHCNRTVGNHRRISMLEIRRLQQKKGSKNSGQAARQGKTAIYARVSSHEQKQKGDLQRQITTIKTYCKEKEEEREEPLVVTDVASGLKQERRGLRQLCRAVEEGTIHRIVVTYPDRLTRFGFDYLKRYFHSHGVNITCVHQPATQTIQETLVTDLIAIVTSFSGRVHGLRSHKNSKQ